MCLTPIVAFGYSGRALCVATRNPTIAKLAKRRQTRKSFAYYFFCNTF